MHNTLARLDKKDTHTPILNNYINKHTSQMDTYMCNPPGCPPLGTDLSTVNKLEKGYQDMTGLTGMEL